MSAEKSPLEVWGGMECTFNRVGDRFHDQMQRAGHLDRAGDLQLFRDLGLKKLRYGLQWERAEAAGTQEVFDGPMAEMQRLGIDPIAGLVHHGSGPPHTSLLDPAFGEKLAAYAGGLAQRYPWIQSYTPVNEPHTTARFSCLYGHWYPHHKSLASYVRAMVTELKASALAMKAIREVRSDAVFVSTEDAGKTYSTPALAAECAEREQRRWLGVDLLCGMVDESHPMLPYLCRHGLAPAEILWFAEHPCPPDVIGLNYYVTSDRFLDDRLANYPPGYRGGDTGLQPLVDVEAVRVRSAGITGVEAILTEAWERYGIPVAITEAHLGGCIEDQVAWLGEVWNGALAARRAGAECAAVTVWALLGSYDWCSLVTRHENVYEPGVFTLEAGTPQPTELAGLIRRMLGGSRIVPGTGWWRKPDRLTFPPAEEESGLLAWEAESVLL